MSIEKIQANIRQIEAELAGAKAGLERMRQPVHGPTEESLGCYLSAPGYPCLPGHLEMAKEYYNAGNWYATRREAKDASYLRALTAKYWRRVAELNAQHDWEADWSDHAQKKMRLYWYSEDQSVRLAVSWSDQSSGNQHYFCAEAESALRESFTEDELRQIITQEV